MKCLLLRATSFGIVQLEDFEVLRVVKHGLCIYHSRSPPPPMKIGAKPCFEGAGTVTSIFLLAEVI
jgi:hypothetical protein